MSGDFLRDGDFVWTGAGASPYLAQLQTDTDADRFTDPGGGNAPAALPLPVVNRIIASILSTAPRELWATSDALPTSGLSSFIDDNWTASPDYPPWDGTNVVAGGQPQLPLVPPDGVIGLFVVVEVDGQAIDAGFAPWGQYQTIETSNLPAGVIELVADLTLNLSFNFTYRKDLDDDYAHFFLRANTATLPANTIVKVYGQYARGAKGEKGDPGASGADAIPHQLDPSVTLPPPDGAPAGALRAYMPAGGEFAVYLNQPRPASEPSNQAQGTAAAAATGRYGFTEAEPHGDQTIFEWYTAGTGANGLLSSVMIGKRHAGTSPPAQLWVRYSRTGQTDISVPYARLASADTTGEYAYSNTAGPRITFEDGASAARFYSDSGYATPYAIKDDRQWLPVGVDLGTVARALAAGGQDAAADITAAVVGSAIRLTIKQAAIVPDNLQPYGPQMPTRPWLDRIGLGSGNQINLTTDAATGGVSVDWNPNNKVEEIIAAFTGDAWAAAGGVTAPMSGPFTPQNIAAAAFEETRTQGARATNNWIGIRIPVAEKTNLANWRVVVGEDISDDYRALYPSANWQHLTDAGGFAYYQREVSDVPTGDEFGAQQFTPFTLDLAKVLVNTLPAIAQALATGGNSADADISARLVAGAIELAIKAGTIQPADLAPHSASRTGASWLARQGIAEGNWIDFETDAASGETSIAVNPPTKLEEVVNAFTGDAWAAGGGITTPASAPYTAANIASSAFMEQRNQGARASNEHIGIRIPLDQKDNLANWRLVIGEDISDDYREVYAGADWTHLVDDATYAYYTTPVTDVPSGDEFGLQKFTPFTLDLSKVDVNTGRVLELLPTGNLTGNTIVNTANALQFPATRQSLGVNLNDLTSGVINYSLPWTVSGGTSTESTGWTAAAQSEKTLEFDGRVSVRRLKALAAYDGNANLGLLKERHIVYNASGELYWAELYFTRETSGLLTAWMLLRKHARNLNAQITFDLTCTGGDIVIMIPAMAA